MKLYSFLTVDLDGSDEWACRECGHATDEIYCINTSECSAMADILDNHPVATIGCGNCVARAIACGDYQLTKMRGGR